MKDIPMFTTPYGVASLSMREIPYRKCAYIRVVSTEDCCKLIEECVSFCRICGAERVYAQGHPDLCNYPLYTAIWSMRCAKEQLHGEVQMLYPVLPENVKYWRSIYNERMHAVPLAAYMAESDEKELCQSGEGYFVHNDGVLLGIGRVSCDRVLVIASVCRGYGEEILTTLADLVDAQSISVEVASENLPAISLYQRMGFLMTAETARWYCVFNAENPAQ